MVLSSYILADDGNMNRHDCRDLIALFDRTFLASHATCLRGGAEEPLYVPARGPDGRHCIHFTRDYFASALHEVAHWCVAGPARRRREDYGYWYAPDGRTDEQQAVFERVEARPQALEWLFSRAAGWHFRPSADNLAQDAGPSEAFCDAIHERVLSFCRDGVNRRVEAFLGALIGFYRTYSGVEMLLRPGEFERSVLS